MRTIAITREVLVSLIHAGYDRLDQIDNDIIPALPNDDAAEYKERAETLRNALKQAHLVAFVSPCPFCGRSDTIKVHASSPSTDCPAVDFAVNCDGSSDGPGGCGATGGYGQSRDEAIKIWNRRLR